MQRDEREREREREREIERERERINWCHAKMWRLATCRAFRTTAAFNRAPRHLLDAAPILDEIFAPSSRACTSTVCKMSQFKTL